MASVVAAFPDHPPSRPLPALPPESLPAHRPSLHVRAAARARLQSRDALVVANPQVGVAARPDVKAHPTPKHARFPMHQGQDFKARGPRRFDWRGWIVLLWALWWAWAYGTMAIQVKAPQVLAWLRALWR